MTKMEVALHTSMFSMWFAESIRENVDPNSYHGILLEITVIISAILVIMAWREYLDERKNRDRQ